jgi:hypothetical protein
MPFDIMKLEINKVVVYNDVSYRVLDTTGSGLLLVAKEEDVQSGAYPIQTFVIPEE